MESMTCRVAVALPAFWRKAAGRVLAMEMMKSHCKINRTDQPRPIQRKKQVRKRIHTTMPYQERLLNMAEARKEIVTALKLHRASMKKQQRQQQQLGANVNAIIPTLMDQIASEQQEQPALLDPSYPITVQDYFTHLNEPSFLGSTPDHATTGVSSGVAWDQCSGRCEGGAVGPRALDEEEMEEIRCIGEMHQMEWDDTLNLATYAWWFRFLQPMEPNEEVGHSVCVANLD